MMDPMLWSDVGLGMLLALVLLVPVTALVVRRQIRRARSAERRARDAQRLAEIGGMTGGLAHEIKNPLSTIGLNAQLLAEGIRELEVDDLEKGRLVRRIEALRREADRLRDILGDFLRFAGTLHIEPARTDLNAVVEELADFYMPQAQHRGVNLRLERARGELPVMLDAAHFKQALLNLMINATQALEALPADGRAVRRPRELILRTGAGRGDHGPVCRVHVIDTGPGVPAELQEKVFTPYFTTKSGGSGLGLPTARRIVEEHGGQITLLSDPEKGTDFTIHLPRVG